jgi:hypothetical protein
MSPERKVRLMMRFISFIAKVFGGLASASAVTRFLYATHHHSLHEYLNLLFQPHLIVDKFANDITMLGFSFALLAFDVAMIQFQASVQIADVKDQQMAAVKNLYATNPADLT